MWKYWSVYGSFQTCTETVEQARNIKWQICDDHVGKAIQGVVATIVNVKIRGVASFQKVACTYSLHGIWTQVFWPLYCIQVLQQITPNQIDVVCMAALENLDKNREKNFLPGNKLLLATIDAIYYPFFQLTSIGCLFRVKLWTTSMQCMLMWASMSTKTVKSFQTGCACLCPGVQQEKGIHYHRRANGVNNKKLVQNDLW